MGCRERAEDTPAIVRRALADGTLTDELFDALLSPRIRSLSTIHWTPVVAAELASRWIAASGARHVLDVGSGAGKFVVLGALSTLGVTFTGIERRPHLADEARRLAAALGVTNRVQILTGPLETIDPSRFEALYLYNPFAEYLVLDVEDHIDGAPAYDAERYVRDVATVERWLSAAREGTRVIVLHGFGGRMPPTFRQVARYRVTADELAVWDRT